MQRRRAPAQTGTSGRTSSDVSSARKTARAGASTARSTTPRSSRNPACARGGMRVRASATVTKVEGRTVFFRVEAHDERELIGDGTHERVVVNVAKFDARVQRKLNPP